MDRIKGFCPLCTHQCARRAFFTLHKQFKKLYEGALDQADTIAERYRQLNPDSVIQMTGGDRTYPEMSDRQLVQEIITQLSSIRQQQNAIWANTNATGDYVTNDLMVQCSRYVDFVMWQFNEFLK